MVDEGRSLPLRFSTLSLLGLVWVSIGLGITGCESAGSDSAEVRGSVKTVGVYTSIAIVDPGLDLPASGYTQRNSFGAGETPAAVIVGYGRYNQPELVTLQLIESGSERTLLSHDYYASYGKVLMQPLAIRLSGNYVLKLSSGNTPLDTCGFTVTRTNQPGPMEIENGRAGEKYAEGIFTASVDVNRLPAYFAEYTEKLNYWCVNAVSREVGWTNAYLFAQRFPGKVVIQCRLDYQGHITGPKILENSLDDKCGAVFLKALTEKSHCPAWPEDVRQKLGADYQEIRLTIYLE